RSAVSGVEGGVPLLVLVTEAHHHQVRLPDQGAGADGVDLRGLVIAPERAGVLPQVVAGGVAGGMIGHRRGEDHVEPGGLGAAPDLLPPLGVDLAGEVDGEAHGRTSSGQDGLSCALTIASSTAHAWVAVESAVLRLIRLWPLRAAADAARR